MENKTNVSEVKEIMDAFGIKSTDGIVRGAHLAQILTYLEKTKMEDYSKTCSKLSLMCGMSKRYLQENYMQGIEDFGIIHITMQNNGRFWKWIGIKAIISSDSLVKEINETATEYMKRKNKEKEESKTLKDNFLE